MKREGNNRKREGKERETGGKWEGNWRETEGTQEGNERKALSRKSKFKGYRPEFRDYFRLYTLEFRV